MRVSRAPRPFGSRMTARWVVALTALLAAASLGALSVGALAQSSEPGSAEPPAASPGAEAGGDLDSIISMVFGR